MSKIKLSKKLTIVGVTLFSALILGGCNIVDVHASVDDKQGSNQVVDQGEKNQNLKQGNDTTASETPVMQATGETVISENNNETNLNTTEDDASVEQTSESKQVTVTDSQGSLIDWNNRSNYDPSANSGIIINYKVKEKDGVEQNEVTDQRGDRFFVGNSGDTVNLTKSLPDGYSLINESDRIQTIGAAYDGTNAKTYIDGITKTVYVTRSKGSTGQVLPFIVGFRYNKINFPNIYLTYLESSMKPADYMTSPIPIGFRQELTNVPNPIDNFFFHGIYSDRADTPVVKDKLTKMTNSVNFMLGDKIASTQTTGSIQLGNTIEISAPTGYKFADGSATKTIKIGAASPMYMAYYKNLGITDIDPSVHKFDVVKEATNKPVLNVHDSKLKVGTSWDAKVNFDNATDENGKNVDLKNIKVDSSKLDTNNPGTYDVTYTYDGLVKTAKVTVLANNSSSGSSGHHSSSSKLSINAPYLVKADNYAQIYNSPSTADPIQTRKLAHDTAWMVSSAIKNSGGTFYKVATHEWVKASDMWAFKQISATIYVNNPNNANVYSTVDLNKKTNLELGYQTAWITDRVAADNDGNAFYRVGIGNYVESSDITKVSPDTNVRGIVKLNADNSVPLYKLDYYGNIFKSSRSLAGDTSWITTSQREINGVIYHNVSNSEWVSEKDSVFIKQ